MNDVELCRLLGRRDARGVRYRDRLGTRKKAWSEAATPTNRGSAGFHERREANPLPTNKESFNLAGPLARNYCSPSQTMVTAKPASSNR